MVIRLTGTWLAHGASPGIISLTITYFHTGCSTIIGAESFHGPVRDGKGWDRLAMVIRHDLSTIREEVKVGVVFSNTVSAT